MDKYDFFEEVYGGVEKERENETDEERTRRERKEMRQNRTFFLGFCLALILSTFLLVKCVVPLFVGEFAEVDDLPTGSARGYVEFYIPQESEKHGEIIVTEISDSDHKLNPTTFSGGLYAPRLRVAATPGVHGYQVRTVNTSGQWPVWNVEVVRGMLTRVAVESKEVDSDFLSLTTYIDVSVSIEAPLPCGTELCPEF